MAENSRTLSGAEKRGVAREEKKYRKAIKNGCNALMICDRIEISDELLKYGATLNINDEKKLKEFINFHRNLSFDILKHKLVHAA